MTIHVVRQIGGEFGELLRITCPVGEVHVPEHENLVRVLIIYFFQCEIDPFDHIGRSFQPMKELRQYTVG